MPPQVLLRRHYSRTTGSPVVGNNPVDALLEERRLFANNFRDIEVEGVNQKEGR